MLTIVNYYWCQVAVSNTHMVVLTAEGLVFTWGEGKKGQLGHGELETWRAKPSVVESLKGKSITRVGFAYKHPICRSLSKLRHRSSVTSPLCREL